MAWVEGDWTNHKPGKYILLDGDIIILEGILERPNNGQVADNGSFVINDWMFGNMLKGTFHATDRFGNDIISKYFHANLLNNAISNCGCYAVSQTLRSDNEDSNVLCLYDLRNGSLLWEKQPETGPSFSYQFDLERNILILIYASGDRFEYELLNGNFREPDRLRRMIVENANGFELYDLAVGQWNAIENNLNFEKSFQVIQILETALHRGIEKYPNQQALIHKMIGEIYEKSNIIQKTIHHFQEAIKLNPKIGLKRKLDGLLKL